MGAKCQDRKVDPKIPVKKGPGRVAFYRKCGLYSDLQTIYVISFSVFHTEVNSEFNSCVKSFIWETSKANEEV